MSDLISYQLFTGAGAPDTTATPTFSIYKNLLGVDRTPPAITHVGDGVYQFKPSDANMSEGVAYLIDNGSSFPKRTFGGVGAAPFGMFVFEDQLGALWTEPPNAGSPTFNFYKNAIGTNLTQPTLTNLVGGYMWIFRPVLSDVVTGIVFEIDAPAGASPGHFSGSFFGITIDGTPPTVTNVLPTPGTNINPTDVISFDITDDSGAFKRIIVMVYLPVEDSFEVIYDGTAFGPRFQGISNTRTPIANGFHYTTLIDGGWLNGEMPQMTVVAYDLAGNENI